MSWEMLSKVKREEPGREPRGESGVTDNIPHPDSVDGREPRESRVTSNIPHPTSRQCGQFMRRHAGFLLTAVKSCRGA